MDSERKQQAVLVWSQLDCSAFTVCARSLLAWPPLPATFPFHSPSLSSLAHY